MDRAVLGRRSSCDQVADSFRHVYDCPRLCNRLLARLSEQLVLGRIRDRDYSRMTQATLDRNGIEALANSWYFAQQFDAVLLFDLGPHGERSWEQAEPLTTSHFCMHFYSRF